MDISSHAEARPAAPTHDADAVRQRVLRARIRLALQQPFLATALMRLPVREVPDASWCPTAATDGYHIFYNPRWVGTLRDGELRGLLAHEVLHVLFSHSGRCGQRERLMWNVACDYAINLLLVQRGFSLPKGGLLSDQAQGKTAEQIYQELCSASAAQAKSSRGKKPAQASTGKVPPVAGQSTDPQADQVPQVGDDLLDPDDPRVRPLRSPDAPDREAMDELRRELREDALARLKGEGAAAFRQECAADDSRRVDWRALLRAWLSDRIKGDWTSYPFSKRMVHRGLFMPSAGMQVPGHVVFAIDTSGSMNAKLLAGVMGELRAFREVFPCRLSVVQCDSDVRSVEEFDAMDGCEIPATFTAHGRGGTDFRPVFEWMSEHAEGALLLYATDGEGTFPRQTPHQPVIWLLTPPHDAERHVPFGAVAKLTAPGA